MPTIVIKGNGIVRKEKESKAEIMEVGLPILQDCATRAEDDKGTYFGGDPTCDVGLHCTERKEREKKIYI